MNRIVIALGSNIDKERNMPAAVALLRQRVNVVGVSPVYETVPIGLRDQPNFFNAAVLVETVKDAATLKDEVLEWLETRLHRERQADKNAPRTIDADIVLFNEAVLDYAASDGRLRHLPDPDLLHFAHIAVPVADLLPHARHPETGEPLRAIADRLLEAATVNGVPPLWFRTDITLDEEEW